MTCMLPWFVTGSACHIITILNYSYIPEYIVLFNEENKYIMDRWI